MQQFLDTVRRIAASDLAMLRRFPRYAMAVLAIALVPALYALIYLTSVWDPNAETHALPVAIVNLDSGVQHRGRLVNVGSELTRSLVGAGSFGFRILPDAVAAREAVRRGELAFAIVIPADFSANAVPGVKAGAGKVVVILSEGNNYASAGFARRFAEDLGHQVNETLNEQRWAQVLETADGSGRSLEDLRAGMVQLRSGLQELERDLGKNNAAVMQLVQGARQAGVELHGLDAKWPQDTDLKQLRNGTQRLAARQRELGQGLELAHGGADKLADGAALLQAHALDAAPLSDAAPVPPWAAELAPGRAQLRDGLGIARDSNARLAVGLGRLDANLGRLLDGMGAAGDTLHSVVTRLPQAASLDALPDAGKGLADTAARLRFGVEMAQSVLPPPTGKPDGSARGLAESVEPALEVLAPVANNGSAFAPNMVAMALWLGAVMVVYVFAMQTLDPQHVGAPRLAQALGKFVVPAATTLLQVLLILLMLVGGLGVQMPNAAAFIATMVVSALGFLAIVFLLVHAFGEAGKLAAVLLLTVQLAAGGGVLPIELSGGLFRAIHDWLPFTWAVRALRASLFGAFDNDWLRATAIVGAVGLSALLLSAFVGRWKSVTGAEQQPPIDV
jgi:putative membrane protein